MRFFALLLVAGALGTGARYALSLAALRFLGAASWGTLLVNVAGTFLLALVATLASAKGLDGEARRIVGVGFCGALTTFSTFALEADELWRRSPSGAALYVGANLVLGAGAVLLGRWLALKQ